MKKLSLMFGILCMALAMQACGDSSLFPIDLNGPDKPDKPDNVHNKLIGTSWELASFDEINGGSTPVPTGQSYVLTFLNDSRVGGTAFCNGYDGTYKVGANGAISMSAIVTTDMYCGPESKETEYVAALAAAGSYIIEGDRLRIFYDNGTRALTFTVGSGVIVDGTSATIPDLLGIPFKLRAFELIDDMTNTTTMVDVPADQEFTLTFDAKNFGSLFGSANCNDYQASFDLAAAGNLFITNLGTTKVSCPVAGSMESEYYEALTSAVSYGSWKSAGKAGLTIRYGKGVLHFESE